MLPGFAALRMRRVPYGENRFFFCGKSGMLLSCSCFLPARQGPKPLFLLHRKRKSGSGLRKRKGGPVEIITGYGTTERWRYAVMVSLG